MHHRDRDRSETFLFLEKTCFSFQTVSWERYWVKFPCVANIGYFCVGGALHIHNKNMVFNITWIMLATFMAIVELLWPLLNFYGHCWTWMAIVELVWPLLNFDASHVMTHEVLKCEHNMAFLKRSQQMDSFIGQTCFPKTWLWRQNIVRDRVFKIFSSSSNV